MKAQRGRTASGVKSKVNQTSIRRLVKQHVQAPTRSVTQHATYNAVAPTAAFAAAEAIRRSPLGLDLPSNHPGLALIASSLEEYEIAEAAVRLVREHGLLDAKKMVESDVQVLQSIAQFEPDGGSRRPRPSSDSTPTSSMASLLDALKRSPLALDLHASAPGVSAIAGMTEDDVFSAAVALMREHGLIDAKAIVAANPAILVDSVPEPEVEEIEVTSDIAAVLDAINRSPLMLNLDGSANGLAELAAAGLDDFQIIGATVALLREHGLFDAKTLVAEDVSILVDWVPEPEPEVAEEIEVTPEVAAALDAINRSPLMLNLDGSANGLAELAASGLDDYSIIQASVALLREHGLMDAKALVAEDVSILINWVPEPEPESFYDAYEGDYDVTPEVANVQDALRRSPLMLSVSGANPGLQAIADAGLDDFQIVGATVKLLREHGLMEAKVIVAEDPSILIYNVPEPEPVEYTPEIEAALDSIKRSPLSLDLDPATAPGIYDVANAGLEDFQIIGATVALLREFGLFEAKAMVAEDPSILVNWVPEPEPEPVFEDEEESAFEDAEETSALSDSTEASLPSGWGVRSEIVDALNRSPLMLNLDGSAKGIAALSPLSDDEIIGATVKLMREQGLFDAKMLVIEDASILLDYVPEPEPEPVLEEEEAVEEEEVVAEATTYSSWAAAAAAPAVQISAELAGLLDAVKRSPLMLDLPATTPGLSAIAGLSESDVIAASVALLREHGLMDAKAMVAEDLSILVDAVPEPEPEPVFEEEATPEIAAILDAIARSPLMLTISPSADGVEALTALTEDEVFSACVHVMRLYGLMDAKEMVAADPSMLLDNVPEPEPEEVFESGAEPSGSVQAVIEAISGSLLNLDLPASTPGLEQLEELSAEDITDAAVALVRSEGLLDAKEMVASDASILIQAFESHVAKVEAEAAAAAEEAAALAAAEEEAAALAAAEEEQEEVVAAPAPVAAVAAAAGTTSPEAVVNAMAKLQTSEIMAELSAQIPGLDSMTNVFEEDITSAVVLMAQEKGMLDTTDPKEVIERTAAAADKVPTFGDAPALALIAAGAVAFSLFGPVNGLLSVASQTNGYGKY